MISWRMQPSTPSVLGVIAIVSVMITATLSEAESDGAIEHGINHLAAAQEDRHFPDSESTTNGTTAPTSATTTTTSTTTTTTTAITATTTTATTISSTISTITATTAATATDRKPPVIVVKDSVTAVSLVEPKGAPPPPPPPPPPLDFATRQDDRNETALSVEAQGELQRDQSDVRPELPLDLPPELPPELPDDLRPDPHSDRATLQDHDPRDPRRVPIDRSALGSPPEDDRNTTPGSLEDFPVSVLSYDESSTRLAPLEYQMMSSSGESSRLEGQRNQSRSTTTEETYVVDTELDDRKAVDDIKAISFQIPAKEHEQEDRDEQEKQQQVAKAGVKGDGKKDPARSPNNILLGGGKSTKAFYEIKPSIKTEMERINEQPSTTTTQWVLLPGRRFVLPSVDSAFGKFGPYFEDGDQEQNITARIGSTVLLDCKIGMLGDKKVTWLQHSKDSFRLLTVGRIPYSVDQRISLNFRYPSNWRLQILYASPRDSGLYKCQVATHPPLVKKINVIVTAPELTITDDAGRIVPKERHLKAGSALRLRCEARDVLESQNESVVWTRGDETLTEDVSENRTSEISASEEVLVIVSTLIVERASPRHAGNYSCEVPGKARTTIAVHVLNGELPAAVHDGNGVSRAVLNLWLIHLTMSYVFSR